MNRTTQAKMIAIGFAIVVGLIAVAVIWISLSSNDSRALTIGGFIVLVLTLIVLVWYAYDTNTIARVTTERWMREGVLSTTYGMDLVGGKGDQGRTLFRLNNPSPLIVRATVNCNFRINGEPVEYHPLYAGKERWLLFPQQMSQGWFDLDTLLQKQRKTMAAMIAESTAANRQTQLTMVLELEFSDELGKTRKLPGRSHYFDFDRWAWIPQLAETAKS